MNAVFATAMVQVASIAAPIALIWPNVTSRFCLNEVADKNLPSLNNVVVLARTVN
jgi:hypothetical protein